LPALPVANASTVSLVEVSLSTVMHENVLSLDLPEAGLQEAGVDRCVGEHVAEHRRHVGGRSCPSP
jgi:hypothetical protein